MGERGPAGGRRVPRSADVAPLALAAAALLVAVVPGVAYPLRLASASAALAFAVAGLAWRHAAAASERTERYRHRLTVVSRAALELQQLRSPEDVHHTLSTLLVNLLPCRSARVLVVEGEDLWLAAAAGETPPLAAGGAGGDGAGADIGANGGSVVGATANRALRERRLVYDEGTSGGTARPGRRSAGAPARGGASTVAVPLSIENRLVAVLELRREGPSAFGGRDREVIEAVVRLAEEALIRLSATEALRQRQRQTEGLARMSERLLLAGDTTSACHAALRHVLETRGVASAAVLHVERDRLVPLARIGEASPQARALLSAGVPFRTGPLARAWREGRALHAADASDAPAFAEGAVAILAPHGAIAPVSDARGATRALLVVAGEGPAGAAPVALHDALDSVATALGATLERLQLERQLHELLDVVRALAQSEDADELYALAVDAAVRLIPGAEAATIMVRYRDGFRFAAAHGYEMADLRALGAFDYDAQVAWYGLGRDAFIRGVPRLVRGPDLVRLSLAGASEEQATALRARGRVEELRATITVPITARRQVLGLLNVDNLSLEDAFNDHELDLAEAFGQHVGAIIRQAQTREALVRAAVTDALTGLGNREGFNRRLEQDLARARRRGEAVHLVMMDLDGFKRINDELGHDSGDEALVRVARALEEGLRLEDGLFRWGGDEFALILSGVDDDAVAQAAERHAEAVSRVRIGGLPMSLSIGIASYPRDGHDAPALLRRADDLMYRHKHRRDDAAHGRG